MSTIKINSGTGKNASINAPGQPGSVSINRSNEVTIYERSQLAFEDAFDYTPDATLTFTNGDINFSAASDQAILLRLKKNDIIFHHLYERWSITATIEVGAWSTNYKGFFLGIESSNNNEANGFYITGDPSTGNKIYIKPASGGVFVGTNVSGNVYTPGTLMTFTVTREKNIFSISVDDGSSIVTNSYTAGFSPWATIPMPRIINRFTLRFLRGDAIVKSFTVKIPDSNIPYVFVGDSITAGNAGDSYEGGYAQLLKTDFPRAQNFAGSSSRTDDILLTIAALEYLAPQKATILIGINDIVQSVPNATLQANYAAIISALEALNIEVILLTILPNGNDAVTNNNWLATTGKQLIDIYTPLKDPATLNMDAAYSSDGVHPIQAGHTLIYNTIQPLL